MKKRSEIILFVMTVVLIALVGLNASRFFARLDLTANKAFTISKVSRQLFIEIPEQVYITYYVSDKLRSLYGFPAQIDDMLQEYAAYSRGKIRVTSADPVASGAVQAAEGLGVYAQQIEVVEQDQRSFAQVYTGIVVQYLDRYQVIPVVSRVESLEYELTSKIRRAVTNDEQVVGLLSGDSARTADSDFRSLMSALSADFSVRPVQAGETIPEDVDVLFVIGNYTLDEYDLFPIDQYIMRGGRALFAVEGMKVDLMRGMVGSPLGEAPVLDLLGGYGVTVRRAFVLDKYCQNFRVPRQVFGQVMWEVMDKYPYWITVAGQFVSRSNPVTAHFQGLDLYWASPLEPHPPEGVTSEVLATTTPDGWVQDKEPFETHPQRASVLALMNHESSGSYPLAVSLRGRFTSYFKGREIPRREGEDPGWKQIVGQGAETRLVVVGDADFATELYQYTGANYNLEFLSNVAGWLGNSEDLLQIKTRDARDLRLNRIQDPVARVRAALFAQLVALVIVPLLVVAFGILRFLYRRRRATGMLREQEG
jgi:gliding-associated putative ABC transporter substrate-binding component GldG